MELLIKYEFKIIYVKGKENKVANSLTRRKHLATISYLGNNLLEKIKLSNVRVSSIKYKYK